MSERAQILAADEGAAALKLRPIHGAKSDRWTVQCREDLLSLLTPDGRIVMMIPQADASRHLRFDWDLFQGRVVSFVAVEGSAYYFHCTAHDVGTLLDWMPQKPRREQTREIRRYAAAIALAGVLQVCLPQYFLRPSGLLFLLLGAAGAIFPRRGMYAVNALVMIGVGLAYLFAGKHAEIDLGEWRIDIANVLSTCLGSLLLVGAVQQVSMLGANHRLRLARVRRSADESENMLSPTIRAVRYGVTGVALILAGQLGGLVLQLWLGDTRPIVQDWVLCIILFAVALTSVVLLRLRPHAAYIEARFAGQFGLILAVLYVAGVLNVDLSASLPFPPKVLWTGLFLIVRPRLWIALVVLVVLFNWWFNRAVERELKDAGE